MLKEAIQQVREQHKTFTHVLSIYGLTNSAEGAAITKAVSDIEYNLQRIEKPPTQEEVIAAKEDAVKLQKREDKINKGGKS